MKSSAYGPWFNSRRQSFDSLEYGIVKFVESFPSQAPVESYTHISASKPELNVILSFCCGVLEKCELERDLWGGDCGHTLIKVKRVLAEPKAA